MDHVDEDVEVEADAIATKLTTYMIDGFTAKEGRPPTTEEIEQLFDELSPDRIAEMLGEEGAEPEGEECDDDEDADEDEEEVDDTKEPTEEDDTSGAAETKESTEKSLCSSSNVVDDSKLQNNENKRQLTSSVVDDTEDKRIRIE